MDKPDDFTGFFYSDLLDCIFNSDIAGREHGILDMVVSWVLIQSWHGQIICSCC